MDSELLRFLAHRGYGSFAFIPDPGFMATCFTHSIAKTFSTFAMSAFVIVTPPPHTHIVAVAGQNPSHIGSNISPSVSSKRIRLGSLQFDQKRHLLIRLAHDLNKNESISAKDIQCNLYYQTSEKKMENAFVTNYDQISSATWNLQLARTELVKTLLEMNDDPSCDRQKVLEQAIKKIQSLKPTSVEIQAILTDLSGEVSLGISKDDYYARWGKPYLYALAHAHEFQTRPTFRDKSTQYYGGALFERILKEANEVFSQAPPPKSKSNYSYTGTPITNMQSYNNPNNPICFHANNLIYMGNGEKKRVQDLRKGDVLRNGATIVCVVKTKIEKGWMEFFCLGGFGQEEFLMTPWHPIRYKETLKLINFRKKWIFANQMENSLWVLRVSKYVYNFVLDSKHIMEACSQSADYECITLGHNTKKEEDEIAYHPYFGSKQIIEDLKKFPGWKDGVITMKSTHIQRDPQTSLICKIVDKQS